jgi:DNA protecting protein DprA
VRADRDHQSRVDALADADRATLSLAMTDRTTPAQQPDTEESRAREFALVTPMLEHEVGITREDLASLLLLESVRGFGPQKFKELHEAGLAPKDVLLEPVKLPTAGKRGDAFREAIVGLDDGARDLAQARAVRQLVRAHEHKARVVTYADPHYPGNVYVSNNPVPVLYVRGDLDLLTDTRAVACVGSRDIRPPYDDLHYRFARRAAERGFTIVSGFALGADTIGHRAAFEANAATTLVMPCGLDLPFPPENKSLFTELMKYEMALAVSEFAFGTLASALTLRKRNKLIVAFAQGVLLSQTSATGGAMNAYRFALEQRKPVATFKSNGTERTSGNDVIERGDESKPQRGDSGQQSLADTGAEPAAVFPADADRQDTGMWDEWLRRSSST